MGFYKYLKQTFQKEYAARSPEYRKRISGWNKQEAVTRAEKPTNVARARELGYKAKPGFVIARVRVLKGLRKREKPSGGRKPSKQGRYYAPKKSNQALAEQRAARHFRNLEVLNAYWVGADGSNEYYEVVLADANKYPELHLRKARAFRGLTAAARKARGLVV